MLIPALILGASVVSLNWSRQTSDPQSGNPIWQAPLPWSFPRTNKEWHNHTSTIATWSANRLIDNGSQVEGNQPQQPFRGKSSYPQQNFRKRKGRTICLNYINPFPRRERQWQRPVSTGYKPSGTEPICSDGVLQDGDPPSGKGTHSTWRLHDYYTSTCSLPYTAGTSASHTEGPFTSFDACRLAFHLHLEPLQRSSNR